MNSTKTYSRPRVTRRKFLLTAGGGTAAAFLAKLSTGSAEALHAVVVGGPKERIASLSKLRTNEPLTIFYPDGKPNSLGFVAKLAAPTPWGVGPDADVVAFNVLGIHRGDDIDHAVRPDVEDCTVLPQIVLKIEGDDVYAMGRIGLKYRARAID